VRGIALIVAACVAIWAIQQADCADEATEQEARQLYAQAFEDPLTPGECMAVLEQLAKDYADTRWADDALWALGEMAHGKGDTRSAILFRRQLLEGYSPPCLEPYTRSLRIYLRSRVPRVLFVLEQTGQLYHMEGRQAVQFNPIPMLTREELALDYERMGLLEMALREYQRAIAAAPPDGPLARLYARRLERLKKEVAILRASPQPQQEPPSQDTGTRADEQGQGSAGHAAGS